MSKELTTYNTIDTPVTQVLYKDKGSKFIGFLFPVTTEEEVKERLEEIKKQYHDARHWCYAYRLDFDGLTYRVNDDGEPSNTAGQPIYGQLLAKDVTNVLLIVVRYFGGIKLGVGGLIKAYRTCAEETLAEANIQEKTIKKSFLINSSYEHVDKVMRIIKTYDLEIEKQEMYLDCNFTLLSPVAIFNNVIQAFEELRCVKITVADEE
ncbi:putative YigZ family protein [Wenyingzhuangia heitensis]|uniref:YigZ family protein n=1 Tax=Wenyingzhuangia heitensis TaxID=1487859 RepID=A0ABX0U7Y4_9FLAO|nr:YigZ family protein [Wenyingzhuangia heitensis]NIJ44955.1 putative YigZ family protein [Wenyingzhuangia heitensis]